MRWLILIILLALCPSAEAQVGNMFSGALSGCSTDGSDGFAGAPTASIQYQNLLNNYVLKPGWCVAGVNYAVGYPASTVLTDWQSISGTGITVNVGTATVTYGSTSTCSVSGVDFSLHNGAILTFDGCANPSVVSSNFNCGSGCIANASAGVVNVLAGTTGNINISNNVIDGGSQNSGNEAALVFISVNSTSIITFQYNWLKNFSQQVVEFVGGGSAVYTISYKFNVISNGAFGAGAHLNYSQFSNGIIDATVKYNTSTQSPQISSGEGYQFYFNGTGTMHSPTVTNNVLIATAGASMSYMIHGSGIGTGTTTLTGTPVLNNNYFDPTGAFGPFYSGSFSGWTLSNNWNMVTGGAISNTP